MNRHLKCYIFFLGSCLLDAFCILPVIQLHYSHFSVEHSPLLEKQIQILFTVVLLLEEMFYIIFSLCELCSFKKLLRN